MNKNKSMKTLNQPEGINDEASPYSQTSSYVQSTAHKNTLSKIQQNLQ